MSSELPHEFRLPVVENNLPTDRIKAIQERVAETAVAASVNSTIGRQARRLPHIGRYKPRNQQQTKRSQLGHEND